MSRLKRRARRAIEHQIATDTMSVNPKVPETQQIEQLESSPEPAPESPPAESEELPPGIRQLVETLGVGDVVVDLVCGDCGTLQVFEQCRSIADAAEQAAADYVVGLGKFPPADILCVCYTRHATFGPFAVSVSLVTEATELRGESP